MSDSPVFLSAEDALEFLRGFPPSGREFELHISDTFTFAGQPDVSGAGMAVILDRTLEMGFMPGGFEQRDGYRAFRYVDAG